MKASPSSAASSSSPQAPKHIGYDDAKALMAEGAPALHAHLATKVEAALGRPFVQMDIRFRHLSLSADVVVVADETKPSDQQDPKSELPTLANELKKGMSKMGRKKHVVRKEILKDFNGVFRPGTMTLILGQPCSGKSALMKVLSGRFRMAKNLELKGDISYNCIPQEQLRKQIPQLVTYVHQRDRHYPTLSVKETFEFAHKCCGEHLPKEVEDLFVHGSDQENQEALEATRALMKHSPQVVIQYLGLDICQDTVVGNHMIRGISGGERKRVTTGEMEFARSYATFMDEITTGLDSAAAYDIIKTQRSVAKTLRKTVVISLLQPPPEVYELFDDVMILNEGEVMYHGPRDSVVEYFESLGFACPPERDAADYLMDLGTNAQYQYQVPPPPNSLVTKMHPRHPSEFAEVFRRSEIYHSMLRQLDELVAITLNEDAEYMKSKPVFSQSVWDSTATLVAREMKILGRNKPFVMSRVIMVVIMGLLYATTFYKFDPTDVQVVMGIIFAAIMFISLGQASQIPTYMDAREIFYKQRASNFYRTWSYVFANTVSRIPLGLAESLIFGTLVYWMCGFVNRVDSFIIFELLMFLTNLAFGSWFFFLAAVAPDLHIAKPLALVTVVFFILSAGFVISPDDMPVYFIWVYWVNPIAWSFRALAINEYMTDELNVAVYKGVNYLKYPQCHMPMGECMLKLIGIKSNKVWIWYGMIYLAACYFIFVFLTNIVLEKIRYEHTDNSDVTKKSEDDSTEDYVKVQTPKQIAGSLQESGFTSGSDEVAIAVPVRAMNFVPVTLAFQDLWYTVPLPGGKNGETIDLLKGISGFALPGKMTALMGSSGAGKTTLMDVIAGRKNSGTIRGKILMNGHEANELAIHRATGYCEQMDMHSEASTIREALTFSAFLRQGSDIPDSVKYDSVEECLELLGLGPIADKIIRGSSVEQMKRLTIGVELAAQPSVLFLDEPTSGLDARSAKLIMDGVRKVADTGRTVVCTIHQPSSEVFFLFDSLLLLKRGGEMVFFGELGDRAVNLVNYFESIPNVEQCPEEYNPATWMLEVIGAGVGNDAAEDKDFVKEFNDSELRANMELHLCQEGVTIPAPGVDEIIFTKKRAATEGLQARMMLKRFVDLYWRTPTYNLTRMFISMFLALLFGLVYLGANFKTFSGINSGVGMIFMTTAFLGAVSLNSVLPLMSEERPSFYRERACQTYNALWYFVGTTICEIPYVALSTFLFTAIFFPMAGFTGVENFVLYWLMGALFVLQQTYLGQLLVFITPSVEVAAILGVLVNSICFLFAGFNPPASAIPAGYKWIYQIVPQRFALSFQIALMYGKCDSGDEVGCHALEKAPVKYDNFTVKKYVADVFDMHYDDLWFDFLVTVAFIVGLRVLAAFALRYLSFQKR